MGARGSLIDLQNLSKHYGANAAVDGLTTQVHEGEVVGFVGANGAGKTTTISLILGFIRPTKGSVSLFGQPVTPSNAHLSHQDIGYAAGDMAIFDSMTGRQYLDFVMAQKKGDHQKLYAALQKIFHPQLDKKIKTLSRGNKQKIALIAAFVTDPKLIVLDEPTSGLDPVMQEAFIRLVHVERSRGKTIFMSSHYLQEVADACTRVLLMKNGRVTHDLTADELRQAGGRQVRLTTAKRTRSLPKGASQARVVDDKDFVRTEFIFLGDPAALLKWLALQANVIDVEITSEGLEAAFLDLYNDEEVR